MSVGRERPLPGSVPVGSTGMVLANGECPTCSARVLWALNRLEHSDGARWFAPLNPVARPAPPTDCAWVMVSNSGEAAVIAPALHSLHVCPAEAVLKVIRQMNSLGFYTADVLRISCTVSSCYAAPGMLCMTSRRDILHRPHGVRVVKSRGEELEDLTQLPEIF